ncbi:helicase POLQ-like [Mercenaria mercenaria]|uniref:helicase POLQ-like n=1 Tax=Mercenaria mercenaria TaxID=6596 RepID=UPI00234E841D|nr:helicase POLQ-like [Mercenaria mercenaria]
MLEVEEGPSRRVSRGRKRGSYVQEEVKRNDIDQKEKCLRSSKKSGDSDWLRNSFQSGRARAISPDYTCNRCPSSSTPKAKRSRRLSVEKENLNTSDALFADLDIDTLTSQALSQSQATSFPSSKNKYSTKSCGKENDISVYKGCEVKDSKNECLGEKGVVSLQTSTSESQSQYFVQRFGNYCPTQPVERKEILIDSKVLSSQGRNDSSFSFSFVGNDTQMLDQTVSVNSICDKINQCVFKVTDVGPKDGNLRDKTCDTQVEHCQLKSDQGHGKLRCTPYFKTADLSVSMVNTQDVPQIENQSQFCIPDGTQSKEYAPVLDTTQLKDDEGFKYRCTPYKTKSRDLCTQTQTQCELMAGTQYKAYLHESYKDSLSQLSLTSYSKQQSQIGDREKLGVLSSQFQQDSQIPCTGICDMTGVIIDSQNKDTETLANTSDCDMFTDSFCDDNSSNNVCSTNHQVKSKELDTGITSHTQSLNCSESSQITQTRRQSLDDDLECMMQESQNLRKTRTKDGIQNQLSIQNCSKPESEIENKKVCLGWTKISGIVNEKKQKVSVTNLIQEQSLSYGDKNKSEIQSELRPQSTVGLVPNLPTTPGGAGSLQDRIKKRLMENAGRRTPQGPGVLMEQLREQVLERVHLEAEITKEMSDSDIGPFYGLPTKVKHLFENYRGIKTLYDWQDECLKLPAILERKNLIYSLPTSGGKTLVAEILILQEILCRKKDSLLVLPFVSIVQEKVRNMSQFAVDLSFYVEEYAGSKGRFPPTKRRNNHSLYIATIEKAHSLINSLIETDRMDNLGLVVVDELHMLGEGGSRGSTLESTLMKILHSASAAQVIGMSATLNNIEDLQKFLNGEVYCNDFRPVTLTEHVKLTESIYRVDQKAKCPDDQFIHDRIVCFQYPPEMTKMDPDHVLGLALEVIPDNSCLVFCPTKKNCENVALMLSKLMAKYKRELSEVKKKERRALLKELNNDSEGKICPVLQYTIHFGIAYHHSGLTVDERKLIEEAYSEGILCLLACTSTLAAGVNLPAKRVILRSPYVGQYFISRSQYKQMVGRAGRAGIDTSGESILICKASDREKVRDLLAGPIESCHSSLLYNEGKGIRTLLLSTIGLKITTTTEDVFKFVSRSLAHCQQSVLGTDVTSVCRDSLQRLVDSGLVLQIKSQSEDPEQNLCHSLEVTQLGKATFKGPIDPDYAEMLYKDLKKAEEPLVISNHLHLLYLVTPYDVVKDITPSWFIYFNQMSHLNSSELKVASLIGVPESYIARKASQQKSRQKVDEFVVSRFYLTLMLYDLWREKSVWEVAEKFQQPRGFIQSLLSSAASFASCVTHFCQELEEFWAYQDLMGNFVKKLSYCVTSELIPLMEIPGVKLGRARLMYTAGYKTLSSVASANTEDLVKSVQYMPRKAAKQIIASAKLLLSEKAEAMMEEVEALVTIPLFVSNNVTMETDTTPAPVTPGLSQSSISSDTDARLNI